MQSDDSSEIHNEPFSLINAPEKVLDKGLLQKDSKYWTGPTHGALPRLRKTTTIPRSIYGSPVRAGKPKSLNLGSNFGNNPDPAQVRFFNDDYVPSEYVDSQNSLKEKFDPGEHSTIPLSGSSSSSSGLNGSSTNTGEERYKPTLRTIEEIDSDSEYEESKEIEQNKFRIQKTM